ncbi:MAG: nuclear transport factor 2 family protein [Solirubrobacteraceae bacterium]|jgi:nuclear transport factor 2 (NTF2) superfamily protein
MTDSETLVQRFVHTWHEPDSHARRRAIAKIWAEDCAYRNARVEFHGRERIEEAVRAAHEAYVMNDYVFNVTQVNTNHDAIRYVWEMVPAAGGEPASIGTHVVLLDADGRMVNDHQFIDLAPPS